MYDLDFEKAKNAAVNGRLFCVMLCGLYALRYFRTGDTDLIYLAGLCVGLVGLSVFGDGMETGSRMHRFTGLFSIGLGGLLFVLFFFMR